HSDSFLAVFLSVLRPPPTSPLFPYTTLFRSVRPCGGVVGGSGGKRPWQPGRPGPAPRRPPPAPWPAAPWPRPAAGRACPPASFRDRKSTRLNSSHVAISYAVFCLKKKKYKHT